MDSEIQSLLTIKQSLYNEIYEYDEKKIKCQNKIREIEQILLNTCKHVWKYDYCYGAHDKPDKVCDLCNSRVIRY
jgi:hypothetical protein